MRHRFLIAIISAALLAAACGSSDGETVAASTDDAPAASAVDDAGASEATVDESEPDDESGSDNADEPSDSDADETPLSESSPLGAFFSDDGGFDAALEEYTSRVNERIVICMANEGFEFIPDTGGVGGGAADRAADELSEREWTAEWGFGISTSFESFANDLTSNPNFAIVAALGPSEAEIWQQTLFGPDGFNLDVTARPLTEQGCIGASIIETGGDGAIQGLSEFQDAYGERLEGLFDTNEMIVAVGDWSQCMSEVGYPGFSELDAPEASIQEKLGAFQTLGAALDELSDEEAQALVTGESGLDALPGLDLDGLRDLQAEERELALVDLDCYDEHVRSTYEPLRNDLENGLISEFSGQLEALRNIGN